MAKGPKESRAAALGAVENARRRLRANPRDGAAHRALGRALRMLGAKEEANEAELDAIDASQFDPEIRRSAQALAVNDLVTAETVLRSVLSKTPDDVAAIRLLADVALQTGHPNDAEKLARHALTLAPGFDYARFTLALALDLLSRHVEALEELGEIAGPMRNLDQVVALDAATRAKLGDDQQAIELYRELLRRQPRNIGFWFGIGELLRFAGDEPGAIHAFRSALEIAPSNGEAWWSLANFKTFEFTNDDLAAMKASIEDPGLTPEDRSQLHFALGKALEDRKEDELAFEQYRQGNAIRFARSSYDPEASAALVLRMERTFTREWLDARKDDGFKARDPIFIIGLTRSGSTLIEQILASHSSIEGTGELPDVILLAKELDQARPGSSPSAWNNYPEILRELNAGDIRRLGETYLERTRIQRKTDAPFFIDKMPNNWFHAGLIRLMLPKAKIIDARRHPLAAGFSNFKQYYGQGQEFTYDLEHLGSYYRDYVRLMAHFESVSSGSIHRVIHERLLSDPEAEIGKLLEFLDLPFEETCLRFYETKRPVRTISAEQVRRPIDASRIDHWKRFEPWLDPMKRALGPSLSSWDR